MRGVHTAHRHYSADFERHSKDLGPVQLRLQTAIICSANVNAKS